jgi:fructose-1,6-bisphosphatase/inositol monophosphatase family enzyme
MPDAQSQPDLSEALTAFLQDALARVREAVLDADDRDLGRGVLGAVPGREQSEDLHAEIDRLAETVFQQALAEAQKRDQRLRRVRVVSEHAPEGYGDNDPDVAIYLDPIDGTDEYLHGIDGASYSVASCFDAHTGEALAAGMADIWAGKLYLGSASGVTVTSLRTGRSVPARPASAQKAPASGVIASYMGRWKYLGPWAERIGPLLSKTEHAGLTLHGKGGSFVYGMIAAGRYLAYVQLGEPVSEVLPGLAFARLARFPVLFSEDGKTLRPFDLHAHGAKDRLPLLIAACTPDLAAALALELGLTVVQ